MVCALGLSRSPQLVSFVSPEQLSQAESPMPAPSLRAVDAERFGAGPLGIHAQLVKTIMPQQPVQSTAAAKPMQKSATVRSARRRPVQSQQAWVMMTTWTESEAGAQMVFTVARTSRTRDDQTQQAGRRQSGQGPENQVVNRQVRINRVSYAAVPFGNGWLIIQI
jgi:hypothetical protein